MIAILMSTYNGERYLAQQLDSILAQTITDWRLTVRDDGSTDGTVAVLREYSKKEPRITLVTDGENIGPCRSFERLLTQCEEAEYYAFADQDDVWRPDKLAICIASMKSAESRYPDRPIVVHTDLQVVDSHLEEIAPSFWKYSNIRPNLLDNNIRYLAICNSVTGCAMMFNQRARACSLPFGANAYMHDAWIALRTAEAGGKVVPVPQTPIAYRQHSANSLGAVRYSVLGKSWEQRKEGAGLSYRMSHPAIYKNKLQFLVWKLIYILHRTVSDR